MKTKDAAKQMQLARSRLVFKQPFFGHLLLQMQCFEITDEIRANVDCLRDCYTMATDGNHIYYDPDFVLSQDMKAIATVQCHEVMHIVLEHIDRIGGRDVMKANVAMDYSVNNTLDSGRMKESWTWPVDEEGNKIALIDHTYDDLSFEAIYARLPDNPSKRSQKAAQVGMVMPRGAGGKDGSGKDTDQNGPDGNGFSPHEQAAMRDAMRGKVIQAAQAARKAGKLPGALSKIINDILNPEIHWTEKLKEFAQSIRIESNYRWARPNRGILAASGGKIIMPSLDGRGLGEIVVIRDTSGSIYHYPTMLERFMGEIESILVDCKPFRLHVIDVDTEVKKHWTINRNGTMPDMPAHGGGGTYFEPAFEYVENDTDINPVCLVYLTDMYGSFPDVEPTYPILWVSYSDVNDAPFGEVIVIGEEERK